MKKFKSFLALIAIALAIVIFATCSMNPTDEQSDPPEPPNAPSGPLDEPSFIPKVELKMFDGTTLQFSEMPVRAQWGIGENPYDIAFVFPLHTRLVQRLNGELVPIYAISEYRAVNRIWPNDGLGDPTYELTLTRAMGREAYGVRIGSTNMGRGLLPVLIDGVTELAVKPGESTIYAWQIDPSAPKPTDAQTLARFQLPSRDIQSDDPEIAALAGTITNDKNSDYEKARAIHQWVAGNIWYDFDLLKGITDGLVWLPGEENWYSTFVLRNKRNICGGYANLTAALLRAADIPAKAISGSAGEGGGAHGWVEAYANARWINMDPTWDSKNRFENGKFSPQQTPGSQWFDVPDSEFSKTHKITSYANYILENGLAATEVK